MRNPNRETKSEWMTPEGELFPQYWNIRYVRNGVVSGDIEVELIHAVENDILDNRGIVGLEKVEWRGSHIGPEWRDVTEWYRNAYQGMVNVEA